METHDRIKKFMDWVNKRFGRYPGGAREDWETVFEGLTDKQLRAACKNIIEKNVKPDFHLDVLLAKKKQPLSDAEYLLVEKREPELRMRGFLRKHRPHLFEKTRDDDSASLDYSTGAISLDSTSAQASVS